MEPSYTPIKAIQNRSNYSFYDYCDFNAYFNVSCNEQAYKYIFMVTTIYDVTLTASPKLDSKPKEKGSQLSPLLVLQSALLS